MNSRSAGSTPRRSRSARTARRAVRRRRSPALAGEGPRCERSPRASCPCPGRVQLRIEPSSARADGEQHERVGEQRQHEPRPAESGRCSAALEPSGQRRLQLAARDRAPRRANRRRCSWGSPAAARRAPPRPGAPGDPCVPSARRADRKRRAAPVDAERQREAARAAPRRVRAQIVSRPSPARRGSRSRIGDRSATPPRARRRAAGTPVGAPRGRPRTSPRRLPCGGRSL